MAVNVIGTFLISKAVVTRMLEGGCGAIVNLASEAALHGNAAGTAYTASKQLLRDDSENVNGQVLAPDGGWSVQ